MAAHELQLKLQTFSFLFVLVDAVCYPICIISICESFKCIAQALRARREIKIIFKLVKQMQNE
jgi:hypothetical protein